MQKVGIDEFLTLAGQHPVLDVRSPREYAHAHIPGAYSLPLFTDEERKVVGTLYKQEGRKPAIKAGLDRFGPKMSMMVAEVEGILEKFKSKIPNSKTRIPNSKPESQAVLVHCWRGGMRSAGVAWLLDMYGFKVYVLNGGYKSFRNYVLRQFAVQYPFHVVGGYTGSGKTELLKALAANGQKIIDLEGLAHHKGSAFGGLGEALQPGQEMFENLLGMALRDVPNNVPIWIEDESRRIGSVNLPDKLWATMRSSPVSFIDVPFEARLQHITAGYGRYKKEALINAVTRIHKRLGGLNAKNTIGYLLEGDNIEAFRILLRYYDKYYGKDITARKIEKTQIQTIPCDAVDAVMNGKLLLHKNTLT